MSRRTLAARAAVTVALLALVAVRLDPAALLGRLVALSVPWVGLALALQFGGVAASSLAWGALLAPFARTGALGRRRLFRWYLVSRFVNLAGPGTVLGDATRVVQTRSAGGSRAAPVAAVLAEKALYVAGFVGVASLAALGAPRGPAVTTLRAVLVAVAAIGLAVGAVLAVVARAGRGRLGDATRTVLSTYRRRPGALVRGGLGTLAVVAATVLSTWALVRAAGAVVPFTYLWVAVPLVAVAVALPVSIQGVGVRETGYVVLLGAVGVPAETAVAVSVASFALSVVVSLSGGALYLRAPDRRPWRGT
ncbi:MAG: YbhN family protein [Halobacteriaceae archaeon]